MGINPYTQYQRTQIETADQGKLLLMLYEGALRFLGRARKALQDEDPEASNNNLVRVQDIVAELMASLDLEAGEVAASLFRLYEYMHYLLVQANIQKDAGPLDQVENMLVELKEAWKEALGSGETGAGLQNKMEEPVSAKGKNVSLAEKKPAESKEAENLAWYRQGRREEEVLQEGYKKVNISG